MNVLLIVTDSTRRDFVSAYDGDELADTPNLDALAEGGDALRPRGTRGDADGRRPARAAHRHALVPLP